MKRNWYGIATIVLGVASTIIGYLQTKNEHNDIVAEVRADIIKELEYAGLIESKED